MKGAMELKRKYLKGNLLINIDSEEAWVTAGSAGGKAWPYSFFSTQIKIKLTK